MKKQDAHHLVHVLDLPELTRRVSYLAYRCKYRSVRLGQAGVGAIRGTLEDGPRAEPTERTSQADEVSTMGFATHPGQVRVGWHEQESRVLDAIACKTMWTQRHC